ncbi:PglZ domain-containing protein [uncultured Thiodictyon sp.]|uniref:PglZ domain-containing protein n=1 Tax=uncultured Thiodictyon sp. TaxID=1846217 RepID=UPI0025D0CC7E|nr:PglZ domain-containing protein [uncultured Thiodictyon sp.]
MSIATYIQTDVLLPRLGGTGVLVVYDPARRYHELCMGMNAEGLKVVDASQSSIESRELALGLLGELAQPQTKTTGLLIYVPTAAPVTDEDRQRDPFSLYGGCGSTFPAGDGDEYLSLCLKAKPDHAIEIRRIFSENPAPSFAVIDAVGGGLGWPCLRALLATESTRDILFALLAPGAHQAQALKGQDTWVGEARDLFKAAFGLKLKTRAKAWSTIADELWRFVLFSEFVFDLPGGLPEALADVPRAPDSARPLVIDLCERLRNDQRTRVTYIDRAEAIEHELNLRAICAGLTDLGLRDTFPFEERTFFAQAVAALKRDDPDTVRSIIQRHAHSVWIGKGESQAQWGLIEAAAHLLEACADFERQLPGHAQSQEKLIDFYLGSLREVDRRQRELEQAVGDHLESDPVIDAVIEQARERYRQLAQGLQGCFTKHLEGAGWPPAGRLANADVFDRLVAPHLQDSGRRVAYFLVDALRYELGVALQQQLAEDAPVVLHAAFAALPSITSVGMASLLPGAGKGLTLARKDDALVPLLGDVVVANVSQRMEVLRKKLGDRFADMGLGDFVRSKHELPQAVKLLVLRSVDIDSHLENNPETTLSLIHDTLKRIRVAIHKLAKAGFHEVVIATDHGFFLNAQAQAGDVCAKPAGTWLMVHDRCLLGDGVADSHSFVINAEKLGVRGDFNQVAGPRSMAPYKSGLLYFHGGASLQELVVPVLTVKIEPTGAPVLEQATVNISYKNGATRITTRLPVIEVLLESDIFSQTADFEILLEAQDKKGNVVGEAKAGGLVNPATGTLTIKPGERVQVTLKMQMDFEGKFTIKALNPTTLEVYCSLGLETDYTV